MGVLAAQLGAPVLMAVLVHRSTGRSGRVLTVIARIDEGAYWTTFNWVYVTVVGVAMFVVAFLQKRRWALAANAVLQVFAVAGFVVHPSMGIMALIFAAVWWYIFYLRKNLIARMKRGLLTTQHT